ncbi:hypothetical protein DNI29_09825 [Hymenobacter sediminis]|uniref:hypothetical protein n=1 Tax=Hymenobacter sediminis TaxID=2218621 RepID=UPI000DA6C8BE|nr:hypothetical protein [Hymenobacter sediminis]RPD47733.1 hypothetical protein DNI29_09825 [Hymenobacter sediminis]
MSLGLLKKHLTSSLDEIMGSNLSDYFFYEYEPDYVLSDSKEIDIIGFQLELIFDNQKSIYISWDSVKGWHQYTLSVSTKSFVVLNDKFRYNEHIWQQYIGTELIKYEVYGYKTNIITTTCSISYITSCDVYREEPHMIVLHFANSILGIANSYEEKDFIPKLPMGDDIWIIYTVTAIQLFIEKLGLEKLEA